MLERSLNEMQLKGEVFEKKRLITWIERSIPEAVGCLPLFQRRTEGDSSPRPLAGEGPEARILLARRDGFTRQHIFGATAHEGVDSGMSGLLSGGNDFADEPGAFLKIDFATDLDFDLGRALRQVDGLNDLCGFCLETSCREFIAITARHGAADFDLVNQIGAGNVDDKFTLVLDQVVAVTHAGDANADAQGAEGEILDLIDGNDVGARGYQNNGIGG